MKKIVKVDDEGNPELVPTHPPWWSVDSLLASRDWSNIPDINGISEIPILREDGTIFSKFGFDYETGFFNSYAGKDISVPDNPILEDAKRALNYIYDVINDFPFSDEPSIDTNKAVFLAGLLTPFARHLIDGPCPLFLLDANSPGTGKNLLCNTISNIVCGHHMPTATYNDDQDELRKTITSLIFQSYPLVQFDEIDNKKPLGGGVINSLLTSTAWLNRILGTNKMAYLSTKSITWYAAGNNISIRDDMSRRVLICQLKTGLENPEERNDFRYPNLSSHISNIRHKLISACLTMLKAYILAKYPMDHKFDFYIGSFEEWAEYVRGTVAWVSGFDPCEGKSNKIGKNIEKDLTKMLLEGLSELPGADNPYKGVTCFEIVQILKEDNMRWRDEMRLYSGTDGESWKRGGDGVQPLQYQKLREALSEISFDHTNAGRDLGMKLRSVRRRIVGGMQCDNKKSHGFLKWYVTKLSDIQVNLGDD